MLCVNDSGELHAKLADLGSAVLVPSTAALRTDATGTSGYAGAPLPSVLISPIPRAEG
jgi:hypothetical protein